MLQLTEIQIRKRKVHRYFAWLEKAYELARTDDRYIKHAEALVSAIKHEEKIIKALEAISGQAPP